MWPHYPEPHLRLEFDLGRVSTDSARNDVEDAHFLFQSDIDFAHWCQLLRLEDLERQVSDGQQNLQEVKWTLQLRLVQIYSFLWK